MSFVIGMKFIYIGVTTFNVQAFCFGFVLVLPELIVLMFDKEVKKEWMDSLIGLKRNYLEKKTDYVWFNIFVSGSLTVFCFVFIFIIKKINVYILGTIAFLPFCVVYLIMNIIILILIKIKKH